MALLFMDSFDHYTTAQISQKWNVPAGSIAAGGRCGTNAYHSGTNTTVTKKTLQYPPPSGTTVIVGFARLNSSGGSGSFFEISNATQTLVRLTQNGDQTLTATAGNATAGPSTTYSTQVDVWNYYEIKVLFSATVGTIEVRIDGVLVPELAVSGADTLGSNALPWTVVGFRGLSGSGAQRFDDLYVLDGSGGALDDFLGDVSVTAVVAQADSLGAGNHQDWGLSTGADHGALVNDNPNDGDATYIFSGTATDQDTFTFPDIKLVSGTVHGVQHSIYARKDDVGERSIRSLVRSGGSTVEDAVRVVGSETYKNYITLYQQNPIGPANWSVATVNAAEFGVKLEV